jgi:hypothetical protein
MLLKSKAGLVGPFLSASPFFVGLLLTASRAAYMGDFE